MNARKGESEGDKLGRCQTIGERERERERERENLHAGLKGKELLHYDAAE